MKKISHSPKDISISMNNQGDIFTEQVTLEGQIKRIDSQIFSLKARVYGQLELICDISGECYVENLDYPLVLYISDGIWDSQSQSKSLDDFDVVEFFDGFVNLSYILESEIESIRNDYHTREQKE